MADHQSRPKKSIRRTGAAIVERIVALGSSAQPAAHRGLQTASLSGRHSRNELRFRRRRNKPVAILLPATTTGETFQGLKDTKFGRESGVRRVGPFILCEAGHAVGE